MKRYHAAIICLILIILLSCLSGCGNAKPDNAEPLKIVCVSFPEYDWSRNILGDNPANIDLKLLISSGTDVHSYQATVQDIAEITSCDLLIHTGGESEQWVNEAIANTAQPSFTEINMMELLSSHLYEEEFTEGMMPEEEDEHVHESDEAEPDEHVWLSLKNAAVVCEAITEQICLLDAAHEANYRDNLAGYSKKLADLDSCFSSAVSHAKSNTIIVADRFPFRYLVEDYGIEYYAAFAGCSAETDASFETVLFLAGKLDELSLENVCIIDGSDARIAKAVISNSRDADRDVLTLDSLQAVSQADIENGVTYLNAMENNLNTLSAALGSLSITLTAD